MEVQWKKHVRVICDLTRGDRVTVDAEFGTPLQGKEHEVESVVYRPGRCETGFLVKISGYQNPVDSNWLNKVEK